MTPASGSQKMLRWRRLRTMLRATRRMLMRETSADISPDALCLHCQNALVLITVMRQNNHCELDCVETGFMRDNLLLFWISHARFTHVAVSH